MIAGSGWRDPVAVGHWAGELPADRDVVVYCVHGHEVSRAAALRLRAAGHRARFLRGGVERWQDEQRPLQAREARA
jgi:Fe-Mn family superoxide dismutase